MPTPTRWLAVTMLAVTLLAPAAEAQERPRRPERVVLFHIDGLHHDAPRRLGMANYLALEREGTRVEEAYILLPWHQTENGYRDLSLTSPPNPTTLAGSLFLDPWWEERYAQHAFYPRELTAHVANSTAYATLNPGMHFVKLNRGRDEENVPFALDLLREHDVRFMRLLLQDTGAASQDVADGPLQDPPPPWSQDIWAEGSPYVAAARNADRLLGEFVDGLKRIGKWEGTLLVLLTDGQASTGWHPVQSEESWRVPLAFVGPGVAKGRTIPYAESTDIVPTVLDLMGKPPVNADGGAGRVLEEVEEGFAGDPPRVARRLPELNRQHKDYLRLTARMTLLADRHPLVDTSLMQAANRLERPGANFYNLERMDQWREAGSLDRMLEVNRAALAFLRERLERSGARE